MYVISFGLNDPVLARSVHGLCQLLAVDEDAVGGAEDFVQ